MLTVNVLVTQDGDYISGMAPTTVDFMAGSVTAMLAIATDADATDEANGSITVALQGGTTYILGDPSTATVGVEDDDLPTITIAGGDQVTEGTDATFTLTRTTTVGALTVNVAVTEQGGNYISGAAPMTVAFVDGEATATLTVSTEDDVMDESSGTITATLQAGDGYTVGDPASAMVGITDDDGADDPEVTIAAVATAPITEGADAGFTLTRTVTAGELGVNVEVTQEGEYIQGMAPTTVTFAAGEAMATLTVATDDDAMDEADGSITATVGAGTGYIVADPGTATVTVEDNDFTIMVTIAAASSSVTEGADAVFALTRNVMMGDLAVNVTVTQDGEYIDGTAPTMASFADGEATATLTVSTTDDEVDEPSGVITATVQDGMGYVVGDPASAAVSIADDDGADDPEVSIAAVASSPITEGVDAVFTLTRNIMTEELMVNVAVTQEGEYIQGMAPTTVTFAAGEAMATLTVATYDDAMDESDGSITATVGVGSGYIIAQPSTATVTVEDNDMPVMVTIAVLFDVVTEGADAVFTLTRTAMTGELMVNVAVTQAGEYIDGTAPTMASFADGEATATLAVATDDDAMDESNGSITATVEAGTGYIVAQPSTATVTVEDNDLPVMVSIAAGTSPIVEGTDAIFTLTRTVMTGGLAVNVSVTQAGEYIDGTAPTMASFADGETTATLTVSTDDDETEETDGSITATVGVGSGYEVGDPASAEVAVTDNDEEMTVGLQAEEEGTLYPNPVGDWLQVTLPKAGLYNIDVYTLSGYRERTYRIKPKQETASVDVSGLASGMYVVILTDAGGQVRQYRVVKE